MTERPHVEIVMGRCRHSKAGFGIRFESQGAGRWVADWAFAVKERSARKEGYDRGQIAGSFDFGPKYPGCPHCGAGGCFKCVCGKVSCYDNEARTVTCPWCGGSGVVSGEVRSLGAGRDR